MISQYLPIKPLSVNKAWQGKRFKTQEYKEYEQQLLLLLKNHKIDNQSKLAVTFNFGFSNTASDIDNPIKPLLDILQKKYGINDKNIYEMHIYKEIVNKNSDFVDFMIDEI